MPEQRELEEGLMVALRRTRPQERLWLKDQCLLGAYVQGKSCSAHQTDVDGPIGCALGLQPL